MILKFPINKLSALLLLMAFSLTSVAASAQGAPAPQEIERTATAEKSDAPDETQGVEVSDAATVPGGSRVAGIGRVAAERPLLASERFDRQDDRNKPAPSPTPAWTPLTAEEKMERAFKTAFLNPEGYATTAFGAAITEYTEDDLPHKDNEDRFADFASRWAIRFTSRATNTLLGRGVFPVLFKQDPRYRPAGKKNFFKRAAHAASRVFVTDDDDGNLEPNYSRWAGALSSSAIANLYEQSTPGRDRIGADATFRRFGSSFTSGMVNNIVREFLPDIIGIFKKP